MTEHAKTTEQPEVKPERLPEPWLRGTLASLAPVERAVLHSLQMAREDIAKWCFGLDDRQLQAKPFGLPSLAFQLRHIAGSLDRFLTYAEGHGLSAGQLAKLASEREAQMSKEELFRELTHGLEIAERRLLANAGRPLETPLKIGRKGLPTTLGGLLVHMAEHTQRHVGQTITTVKVVLAQQV